jgi:hypothetical protein
VALLIGPNAPLIFDRGEYLEKHLFTYLLICLLTQYLEKFENRKRNLKIEKEITTC